MTYHISENGLYNENGIINLNDNVPEGLLEQLNITITNSSRLIDVLLEYLADKKKLKIEDEIEYEIQIKDEIEDWSDVNSNFSVKSF